MKKLVKLVSIMLVAVTLLSAVSVVCAVTNPSSLKGTNTTAFNEFGKKIIGMVQAIGSIASVLVLVILGVKFMMGSAEEKAEYKKTFIPYLIGAILVFSASNIASLIYSFATTSAS